MRRILLILWLLTLTAPAFSSDGVLEISQTCAVETGCFEGDEAAFPVVIKIPGSYRLTSNLDLPDENTTAIELTAENVTLDLAGFSIIGPVSCSGTPTTCSPADGTGVGISAPLGRNIIVKNGTVRGVGEIGISLGKDMHVDSVTALSNGIFGISIFSGTVVNSIASNNGFTGIFASDGPALVTGCTSMHNGSNGIVVFEGTASNNTSNENGRAGITCEQGSLVTGNSASENGLQGIKCDSSSTISNNRVSRNGSDGIDSGDSTVFGNVAASNTGLGLKLFGVSGYAQNVLRNNNGGNANPQVSGGVETGTNVCGADTVCP